MEYQRHQQGAGPGRTILFGFVCLGIMVGWTLLEQKLWPRPPQPEPVAEVDAADQDDTGQDTENGADRPADPGNPVAEVQPGTPQPADVKLPGHRPETIVLGSLDPDSGFRMRVQVESFGAAVRSATLNDKRFVVADLPAEFPEEDLPADFPEDQPRPQLRLLGNNLPGIPLFSEALPKRRPNLSFDMAVDSVDRAWRKVDPDASLTTLHWRVAGQKKVPGTDLNSSVTLELESPDKTLTFSKTFRLNPVSENEADDAETPDLAADMLDVILEISNSGTGAADLTYDLYGPVGLPLEDEKNARKFRDIQAGFLDGEDGVDTETLTAADLVSQEEGGDVDSWSTPVKYIGLDVQYFAALMFPADGQAPSASIQPELIGSALEKDQWHDLTVKLKSSELTLKSGQTEQHSFQVYLGPKTTENLASLQADGIIDAGWFPMIRHAMVWLLNRFHNLGLPFGIAIILLTVCVRCCMFPISRKMARSQNRMKALQPQIAELKEKFKDEPQKMSQAQMELWRKEGVNPLGGCLPALCQLPIFVALYSALYSWVDLRMASFLWIDNLAAPDHLADLPFEIPFLGGWFNLLPLVTVGLFYAQQKMTMPAPINDEMAMQQKVMTYMMIFMGFLFYSFPAGLNVYFIASSMWGMCERKILEKLPEKPVDPEKAEARRKKKENGWFARMMKQAMESAELQKQLPRTRSAKETGPAAKKAGPARKNQGRGGSGKKKRRR